MAFSDGMLQRLTPRSSAFDPEEVIALVKAFDRSWEALSCAFDNPNSRDAQEVREALASCILRLAERGERNPEALTHKALASLPIHVAR